MKRQTLEKENEVRFTPRQVYGWKQEEKAKQRQTHREKERVALRDCKVACCSFSFITVATQHNTNRTPATTPTSSTSAATTTTSSSTITFGGKI